MPPPLGVFGINTIYLPAIEMKVLKAAPFWPLSSLITCTRITWLGLITSWILYLLNLNLCLFFFSFPSSKFSFSEIFSLLFESSSVCSSNVFSKGSSISNYPSAIFSSSLAWTSLESSSLAFSSSCLILSKSAFGIW